MRSYISLPFVALVRLGGVQHKLALISLSVIVVTRILDKQDRTHVGYKKAGGRGVFSLLCVEVVSLVEW